MTFETGILIIAVVLALAAVPVVHRIVIGPSILDRTVASDMLVVLLVMAMALHAAYTRSTHGGVAMLSLTALAFLSSVAIARFVAREDVPGGSGGEGHQADDHHHAISDPGEALDVAAPEGRGNGGPREDTDGTGEEGHGDR